jgi:hypothetical protein
LIINPTNNHNISKIVHPAQAPISNYPKQITQINPQKYLKQVSASKQKDSQTQSIQPNLKSDLAHTTSIPQSTITNIIKKSTNQLSNYPLKRTPKLTNLDQDPTNPEIPWKTN